MTNFDEFLKFDHRLQGYSQGVGEEIAKILDGALSEVQGKIADLSAKADLTESLVKKRKYLIEQRKQLDAILNVVYGKIGSEIFDASKDVALATPKIIKNILVKAQPLAYAARMESQMQLPIISDNMIATWHRSFQVNGLFISDWLKKLEANAAQRVVKEVETSMILNEPYRLTTKRIHNAVDIGRRSAQGLAQTCIFSAKNFAERELYMQNPRLEKLKFVTELDCRVCPICGPLDQEIYPKGEAPQPPLHWKCRCRLMPVMFLTTIDGKEVEIPIESPAATRPAPLEEKERLIHHRDGTTSTKYKLLDVDFVPHTKSYESWLNSLVKSSDPDKIATAKEILGPTRFDLVSKGKLRIKKLYYHGKFRKITQLKKMMEA